MSDDGAHGLTIIAFIGSVFSPYYALARRRRADGADPKNHVALNVALYGRSARRWTMTERGCDALTVTPQHLQIGPSSVRWDGNALIITIDEVGMPLPQRVTGVVRVTPHMLPARHFQLDAAQSQIWQPIAPSARIEARFSTPALTWSGQGYFDHNRGTRMLEAAFKRWDWSRQSLGRRTHILYDVEERAGARRSLALDIAPNGEILSRQGPARAHLPPARIWRIPRATRCDAGTSARVTETLEDTPFYARSIVETSLWGTRAPCVHESLELDRFKAPIVQVMLPFRMPRRAR